jgi:type II secretory pathway component PulM
MAEVTVETTAWRQGYEAALRDVEQHAAKLQEQRDVATVAGVLAEVRAALTSGPTGRPTPAEATGIPAEDLEREWTAG